MKLYRILCLFLLIFEKLEFFSLSLLYLNETAGLVSRIKEIYGDLKYKSFCLTLPRTVFEIQRTILLKYKEKVMQTNCV